uniref:Methyltransferase domain-containing protein n=1 Tax=Ditylum brightwellii TaxID=49249 RepID=A0A7S2EJ57_9STRA|mmetsp:Transcript_32527/g.48487  ORF Transcript_32527/g.48487 Transcript_32527/m.48487 type:complete len:435 (+) Transcript_32527:76-1380(+)
MPSGKKINDETTTTATTTKKKKQKVSRSTTDLRKKSKRKHYSKLPSSSKHQRTNHHDYEDEDGTTSDFTATLTGKIFYYQSQLAYMISQIARALPHPVHTHTLEHRHIFSTASLVLLVLVCVFSLSLISTSFEYYDIPSYLRVSLMSKVREEYQNAYQDSLGFFTDITNEEWKLMKDRVKNQPKHNDVKKGLRSKYLDRNDARTWYQNNWNPDFTCPHELRVGGTGDGPKWVCDPHRIVEYYQNHPSNNENDGCLIYSVDNHILKSGNPFSFELAIQGIVGVGLQNCEIHVFDPHYNKDDHMEYTNANNEIPKGIILHPWGIEGTKDRSKGRTNYMTLSETVEHLNHEHRIIDIFKMDCEECEWNAYSDWFSSKVEMRQILIELHGTPKNDVDFFESMKDNNYVIFHKEADTQYGGIWQEYGFLKLAPEFFENR